MLPIVQPSRRAPTRLALCFLAAALALSGAVALAAEAATYSVRPGDTLSAVAVSTGVGVSELVALNDVADPDLLRVGQVLHLPSGAEVARPALSSRGARAAPQTFVWPLRGRITTDFAERGPYWSRGWHPGLDIAGPIGTPIAAAAAGVVVEAAAAGWNAGYGNYVKIEHGGGLVSLYGHMSRVDASVGDQVDAGTVLGAVGVTGLTTGPHVHLELRQDGEVRDPVDYLP